MTAIDEAALSLRDGSNFQITSSAFIPRERYFDEGFFHQENERLWRNVWQVACREDEIPEIGDYVEYRILDQSFLVVRGPEGKIRAFHNACRHRATQLGVGNGSFANGRIVCPFHGWQWNLEGESTAVFRPEAFPPECLIAEDIRLGQVLVDTWLGYVFINPDSSAAPLHEFLSPIRHVLDDLRIDDMTVEWWKSAEITCNWKIALEAFMEGYHVDATHPQMSAGLDVVVDYVLKYTAVGNGHSYYHTDPDRAGDSPFAGSSHDMDLAFLQSMDILARDLKAMVVERDMEVLETVRHKSVPEGSSMFEQFLGALYEENARQGIELPDPAPEVICRWSGVYFVFPNFFISPAIRQCIDLQGATARAREVSLRTAVDQHHAWGGREAPPARRSVPAG